MKIGILSLFYGNGGIGGHVRRLSENLHESGQEVHVFTPDVTHEATFPKHVVPISLRIKLGWRLLLNAQLNGQVRKALRGRSLDLLHGNPSASFGSPLSKKLGTPHVATIHGSVRFIKGAVREHGPPNHVAGLPTQYTGSTRQRLNSETEIWMEEYAFRESDAVIAVSRSVRDFHISVSGRRRQVFVIPPFVDPPVSDPQVQAENLIPGYKEERTYFLYVGPPTVEKGFHYLLEAIPMLAEQLSDFRILLAGHGYNPKVLTLLRRNNLARHVQVLGWLNRRSLSRVMKVCTALIVPSLAEGHPISIAEAMFHGLPAVAFDTLGIRDVISNRETGLLVQTGDVESLVEAAAELTRYHDFRRNLGSMARRGAVLRYDPQRLTEQTLDVYKKVLDYAS